MSWQAIRASGAEALAERASKKLKNDLLVTSLASTSLRLELDRVPLWRGDSVQIRELLEYFGRFLYLPKLRSGDVLLEAIRSGLSLLTWEKDSFAYAESYDDAACRFRGLRYGTIIPITADDSGYLVKPEAARKQIDREATAHSTNGQAPTAPGATPSLTISASGNGTSEPARATRYHGTVRLGG